MNAAFYIAGFVAVLATALAITRRNVIHALLYLIVSLLAVAAVFFTLGAPFIAALEAIIYAGAIMTLFLFVIMTLNLGTLALEQESRWLKPGIWIGPSLLAAILLGELVYDVALGAAGLTRAGAEPARASIEPAQVGAALFGPYLIGVELAAMLLLAGLVGALHLGRRDTTTGESRPAETRRN